MGGGDGRAAERAELSNAGCHALVCLCPYNGAAWKTGKDKGQTKTNALIVDERLRVCGLDNVFALGDCAMEPQRLPQTAQVASQEGKWLGQYQLYLCCFSSWLQPCTASKP